MKIYIVRHGETEWNREEIFRGRRDIPLNEKGRMQAERTAQFFKDKEIKAVFSSPLSRALEMAQTIGKVIKVPVETREEFNDMAFGKWEGLSLREVEKGYPRELLIWRQWPQKFRIAGAENLTKVRKRLIVGLRDVLGADYNNLLIVTHRVICKVLILHLLGIANEHFWKMKFDPAAITLIDREDGQTSLHFMNETCHLKDGGGPYRDF
jgi:broad specificity phosphatase PhoE